MQEAFRENHGLQCGFCTPGMIMAAVDMVNRKGNELDDTTIRHELDGNLCRCTGYHNIVKAIAAGAQARWKGRQCRRPPSNGEASDREETAMSATGIGAAVRRKEDLRFITGKGSTPTTSAGRARPARCSCARRTRTPRSSASTSKAAAAMPGVLAVLTGARTRATTRSAT